MFSVEELRYPFSNFIEFTPHILDVQAFHLVVGFAGIVHILLFAFDASSVKSWAFRFAATAISLSPYNNPAFTYLSISISDALGMLAVLIFLAQIVFSNFKLVEAASRRQFLKIIPYFLLVIGSLLGFIHANYSLTGTSANQELVFISSNMRLVISAMIGLIVITYSTRNCLCKNYITNVMSKSIWWIFAVQLICYFIYFFFRVTPYGTFQGAGFIDIPAFGAVSIERGHLGRIIALFPAIVLIFSYESKSYKSSLIDFLLKINSRSCPKVFYVSLLSVLLSLSTSAYFLLISQFIYPLFTYCISSLKSLFYSAHLRKSMSLTAVIIVIIATCSSILWPLIDKAFAMIFGGSGSGVRGLSIDLSELKFLGIGYYGSTLRENIGVESYDLGLAVNSLYFGLFYYIFIFYLLFRFLSLQPGNPFERDLYRGAFFSLIIFNVFEVSIGQYSAVCLWFLLP